MRFQAIMFAMSIALFLSGAAHAHKPIAVNSAPTGPSNPFVIEDSDVSQVVYHDTSQGAAEVWLKIQGPFGDKLFLQVGMPAFPRQIRFRPAVALVGPGLPLDADVPFALPAGMGAVVFDTLEEELPPEFFEPFTGTTDWIFQPAEPRLPAEGTYYVVAYFPRQETGKLLLVIGDEERFTLAETFNLPAIGKEVRRFHELNEIGGGIFYIPFTIIMSLLVLVFSLMFA